MKQVMYIVVVTCKLPIPFLYLAHGMEALGGSFAAMLSAIFSVTSDITQSGVGRLRCIALLEALQTLSSTAAQIYTAQWMRYGYVSPLICALANCCLAFMMAILFPETLLAAVSNGDTKLLRGDHGSETGQVEQNSCLRRVLKLSSKCWKMIRKSVMLYVKHDSRREIACGQPNILCKRRLVLIIFICTVAVNFSRIGVEALFQIKYPLCWAATKVYTFTGIRIFLSWVAILVMLILMQKVFKMADRHVAIVGIVSSLLSNAAISLAVNDAMVYEAAIVGFMTRSIIPMLRSTMSSLVDYASQGAMYSSLSCVESLGAGIFSTAAYRIYYTTLSSWAGEIFMIFACIMAIALTLLVILNVIFARESTTNNVNTDVTWNIQENNDSDIES